MLVDDLYFDRISRAMASPHRSERQECLIDDDLLYLRHHACIPNNKDLKNFILWEAHDKPIKEERIKYPRNLHLINAP